MTSGSKHGSGCGASGVHVLRMSADATGIEILTPAPGDIAASAPCECCGCARLCYNKSSSVKFYISLVPKIVESLEGRLDFLCVSMPP